MRPNTYQNPRRGCCWDCQHSQIMEGYDDLLCMLGDSEEIIEREQYTTTPNFAEDRKVDNDGYCPEFI